MDCLKCFEVIYHEKLLSKLEAYGVDTYWLAEDFFGHTQRVKIAKYGGAILSAALLNSTGVHQGSRFP